MVAVTALWTLAMAAGALWNRRVVALCAALTLLAWYGYAGGLMRGPLGWWEGLVLATSPWLLSAQRRRYEHHVRRSHAKQALSVAHLQRVERTLRELQQVAKRVEADTARITELYHVTKETIRAMRVEELFEALAAFVPSLLGGRGLRMIVRLFPSEEPKVWRTAHGNAAPADAPAQPGTLLPIEQAVLERAARAPSVSRAGAVELHVEMPLGVREVAWAPLWGDQRLIGVLIVDELREDRLDTLSIVASQLALQLERVALYQAVEAMAITDSLTGLFVRRYFLEFAAEELKRSHHHRLPCALLMIDLDAFKAKNDTYGHLAGDVVLRETCQRLRHSIRGMDLLARYGGEELVCLLAETDPARAMKAAERLREVVEIQPIRAYDEVLHQTISIGVACAPEDGATVEMLIARADAALYAAKRAGRNRVMRWTKDLE